jgi:uncharacterized protein YndB with AHSA1/START domain
MQTAKSEAAPKGVPEFYLSRLFDAPRALVFKCWIDAGHLARWWGPEGFTNPVCEADPKPGGVYRIVMRGPDGSEHPMKGVFREIVANERIVKEDDLSEHSAESHDLYDPGRDKSKTPNFKILTTVTFADEGKKTRVTIRQRFDRIDLRDNAIKVGMYEGWSGSFEKLDDLVAAIKGSEREIVVTRVFDTPRAVVFKAFSDAENIGKWWGPNGFTTTVHEMDFRTGGEWRHTMHGPDGKDHPNRSVYTEIKEPERIAYDHYAYNQTDLHFRAVVSFEEQGRKTRVSLRLKVADRATRDGFVNFGAVEGGYETLGRLGAYLAKLGG